MSEFLYNVKLLDFKPKFHFQWNFTGCGDSQRHMSTHTFMYTVYNYIPHIPSVKLHFYLLAKKKKKHVHLKVFTRDYVILFYRRIYYVHRVRSVKAGTFY